MRPPSEFRYRKAGAGSIYRVELRTGEVLGLVWWESGDLWSAESTDRSVTVDRATGREGAAIMLRVRAKGHP